MANVEEEEAWINEKLNLVASEDYGDTLAAVQVSGGGASTCPAVSSSHFYSNCTFQSQHAATLNLLVFNFGRDIREVDAL